MEPDVKAVLDRLIDEFLACAVDADRILATDSSSVMAWTPKELFVPILTRRARDCCSSSWPAVAAAETPCIANSHETQTIFCGERRVSVKISVF
jgi:hypothetical protein